MPIDKCHILPFQLFSLLIVSFVISSVVFRYTVMSGTPQKMLEHLLETRLGGQVGPNDPFLDDFILTHIVFMPVPILINELANLYPFQKKQQQKTTTNTRTSNRIYFSIHLIIQFPDWFIYIAIVVLCMNVVCYVNYLIVKNHVLFFNRNKITKKFYRLKHISQWR